MSAELIPQPEENLEEEFPDELVHAFTKIVDYYKVKEDPNRWTILREIKKNISYFNNIQRIWWDATKTDWRFITDSDATTDSTPYDYREDTLNVIRPYGEAVIAALGVSLPKLLWAPTDAENPDDILKSKAYQKIVELIELQNNMPLGLLRLLYILWNQHFVATRLIVDTDKKYGSLLTPRFRQVSKENTRSICPTCGSGISEGPEDLPFCDSCQSVVEPEIESYTEEDMEFDGYDQEDKSRILIKSYGPLHVYIPSLATDDSKIPFLIFEEEVDLQYAKHKYHWVKDKLKTEVANDSYGRWARLTLDYNTTYPTDICTERHIWLEPCAYEYLDDPVLIEKLEGLFPKGVHLTYIGDTFVEAIPTSLSDEWTLSRSPISEFIHSMPVCRPAMSVQEMRTEMVDLTLSTIEQGVPETWADPKVVDFESYNNTRKEPGRVFPILKKANNEPLDHSFFQLRSASLPNEVPGLIQQLDKDGQFITGAYPSTYGGPQQGGSNTLGEYQESRAMALQRLGIIWRIVNDLYIRTMDKACKLFETHMLEDEKFAKQNGNSWINVYIRKAEMGGNIGRCLSQSADQFPVSWDQKTARMFELLNMGNEALNAAIFHPDNAFFLAQCLGLPDLFVPGENERNKQLMEIGKLLATAQEMQLDPMTGMPTSTVPIEPLVDNDEAHISVIQAWANSEAGQLEKEQNQMGYQNVMAHLQEHQQNIAVKQLQMAPPMEGPIQEEPVQ